MILIAKYDCYVAGIHTSSVDYQVRYYDITPDTDLEAMLKEEIAEKYKNDRDQDVARFRPLNEPDDYYPIAGR